MTDSNSISPAVSNSESIPNTVPVQQLTEDEILQQEEWKKQIIELEKEIATLRTVITFKSDKLAELKRKLGVGVFYEFNTNVRNGLQNIKETEAKLGEVRGTNAFKSIEERMGDAYTTVKSKVAGPKSDEQEFGTCSPDAMEAKESTTKE